MEYLHNCGNCAHFEACDSIMKRYAGLSGIAKNAQACGNYAMQIEDFLGGEYDLDRLRELVNADRDGRCVILPCKVGTHLYRIGASICKWREIDHCDEYCDGWQYRDCWEGSAAIVEESFNLQNLESIGKTVFLTCEEAEAALNEMKKGVGIGAIRGLSRV